MGNPRWEVLPPKASVSTRNQSRPFSGSLPEGGIITGGHHHHPGGLHNEEGVVLPRGWGYVPVAMCCISLSLSCSWWHDLDVSRVCCYRWIIWSSSPLYLLDELSFPFEFCCRIESLMIWEHLICVLHEDIYSDIGLSNWLTWCILLWSTCGFRDFRASA